MGNLANILKELIKPRQLVTPWVAVDPIPGLKLRWLGCAGVMVSDSKTCILIDPFVSRYGIAAIVLRRRIKPRVEECRTLLNRLGVREAAAVIVSHSHYDHAMDAPYFAMETGALLIGSESTANIARGAGLSEDAIRVVAHSSDFVIGTFHIRVLESEHGPGVFSSVPFGGEIVRPLVPPVPAAAYRLGKTFSFIIEHPAGTVVHHGSAGYKRGMYKGMRADAVLLGIAGRGDTSEYLKEVVVALGARLLIPIHHDNFFSPLNHPPSLLPGVDMAGFLDTAKRTCKGVSIEFLPPGW